MDDKIIERAKKEGLNPLELSKKYIHEYFTDMDDLGVKRADNYPLVSENIPRIVAVLKDLVDKKKAYVADGDVYLDVAKIKDYGRLSGQPLKDLKVGARVEVDEKKKGSLDFVLWKKAKPGEISWSSPWGNGRPGWHIECSVMSIESLGPTIDIHGGGQDLIFPHHDNEVAQSEAYTGKRFVRYWLHNGLVTVEGEKMSKSIGNFITIRELLNRFNAMAVRFFLLSAHYRRPLDFSERALSDAQKGLKRIQSTFFNLAKGLEEKPAEKSADDFEKRIKEAKVSFKEALEDDFNIPMALASIFDFIRDFNTYASKKPTVKGLTMALKEFNGVLGLSFEEEIPPLLEAILHVIIETRVYLREKKDFESADRIRSRLLQIGIALEDRKQGTIWRFTNSLEAPQ